MKSLLLMALLICMPIIPLSSERVSAVDDSYDVREIDSFELVVNETSEYGSWSSFADALGAGAGSYVVRSTTYQTHGLASARCNVSGTVILDWAEAGMTFISNSSNGLFLYDRMTIDYRMSDPDWTASVLLRQYNGSVEVDRVSGQLAGTLWQTLTIDPTWAWNTTHFRLDLYLWHVFEAAEVPASCDLYLDNFRILSGEVPVRIRYWNLYTGLGYYAEKLLCRYYDNGEWVDVWQNEFIAYKGDLVAITVTDIFGRYVWTGTVEIDETPKYVDILVPIVTVHIAKPDWYNDSVPFEWRITCLPWGPDGPTGMTLPAIGFEFEVLAGWYTVEWLANGVVSGGNRTIEVEGNATEAKSFMLTDLSIPIDPDYEVQIEGDDGMIFDLRSFDDFVAMLAALGQDSRFQAVSVILVGLSVLTYAWQAKKLARRAEELNRRKGGPS